MAWEKLTSGELISCCDPLQMNFETTEEIPPLEEMLGQERAVRAMEFGLKIKRPGYNIFMTGLTGTGKLSYAQSIVQKMAAAEPVPDDWCYVYNFENPGEPIALNLPAGMGTLLQQDMIELLDDLKETIPKAFDSDDYEKQKASYLKEFQERRSALLEELNQAAQGQGFALRRTSSGFVTIPVVNGEPISEEDYAKLDPNEREKMEKNSSEVQIKGMEIMRRVQKIEKELKENFKQLDQRVGLMASGHLFNDLIEKYAGFEAVRKYFKAVQKDLLSNLSEFRGEDEEQQQNPFGWLRRQGQEQIGMHYKVNLVVNNREGAGAPVVYETNPSYYNLLGRVEYENRMGMVITDFTMIKEGAFHRANGGYLILQAMDVLLNPQAWEVLKRVLKTREIRIENIGEHYGLVAMSSLRPAPIPLQLSVIMIGNPYIFQLLYHQDEDFKKLFKIKADFDVEMDNNQENVAKMAAFTSSHCRQQGLKHFDRFALARVIEYSCRLAEQQGKMSTRFNDIIELLYEADSWAVIEGAALVGEAQVKKALEEKVYRSNKYENKLLEAIERGQILLQLEGEKVGQINGLSVLDLGDYQFGRPSRITANSYLGRKGIINIERESQLSGRIHDKGVLILSGYLGWRYGQMTPINLSASLCFEQSYSGVEGDSASAAELFALLSSIADIPLKQGLAVTGSVNQKGEIQPIGGVNQKIEGHFLACKVKGLNGEQGVIIPVQNRLNLMLKEEVIQAVEAGRFHIYSISTVDEGLELLTGMEAGQLQDEGTFPPGTFNALVIKQLERYNKVITSHKEQETESEQEKADKNQEQHCG